MTDLELGQALFTAYNAALPNPWQTHDGRQVPLWNELNDVVRGKWAAAAAKARELLVPSVHTREFSPHADSPRLVGDGHSNDGA